jgi:hypothetical protein
MVQKSLNKLIINLGATQVNASSGSTTLSVIDRNVASIQSVPVPGGLTPELTASVNQLKTCVSSWGGIRVNFESFFKSCIATTASFKIDGAPTGFLLTEVETLENEIQSLKTQAQSACTTLNCFLSNLETALANVSTGINNCHNLVIEDQKRAQALQQQADALRSKMKSDWWGFLIPGYNIYEITQYVDMANSANSDAAQAGAEYSTAQNLLNSMSGLDPLTTNVKLLEGNLTNIACALDEADNSLIGAKQLLSINTPNTVALNAILNSVSSVLNQIQASSSAELR